MNLVDLPREYCRDPILIGQNLWNPNEAGSGCSVLDVHFPRLIKIAGISFKNFYTAEIQIWLKYALKIKSDKQSRAETELVWITAVPKMILMPHPHYEIGASDHFTLVLPSPYYVAVMRMVLKQPSFLWKKFSVHQMSIIEDLPDNIFAKGQFVDAKSKRHMERIVSLVRQTKSCVNRTKYENLPAGESSKTKIIVPYELISFPHVD